jgi:FdhE protein
MTQEAWLARHPYLQPVADFEALVHAAASEVPIPSASIPWWDDYSVDFHAGVPLLQSARVSMDLDHAEGIIRSLVERLASRTLPGNLAEEIRILAVELHCDSDSSRRAVAWLLDADLFSPTHPGLLHYLGWTALAHYLCPVVSAFSRWRNEERWLRHYCPTCGAPPAMAQLVGIDPGRLRLLSCGRCATRWRYRRTGCPFCQNEDDHRLAIVAIEGEGGLRIDHCEACGGYLKTYNGEGNEGLLLADWSSLHLDILAGDRGLKRLAASLYEL